MSEICIFAGTTEGRRLAEYLSGQLVDVCACVATEYGSALMPQGVEVLMGRLDGDAMRRLFEARRFDLVIDATHPFATLASDTIAEACAATGTEYLRLNRDGGGAADAVVVDSIQGAADFLKTHPGAALLTTGSKELAPYTEVENYRERFYIRVLPMAASIEACAAAGFAPAHIIAMQGPFSVDMNAATLKAVSAAWLVTKASGKNGGFDEKLEAARLAGARCIVIGQPEQRPGLDYAGVIRRLNERYHLKPIREIDVVGIGMGSMDTLTFEADAALRRAEYVIGAKRMLEAVARYGKPCFEAIAPSAIMNCIDDHPECQRFAVAMSGDTGFYSGAKKLLPLLERERTRVIPGLSTMQVLCARFKTCWDDVTAISLHGREGSVVEALRQHGRVFALTDGTEAIRRICAELIAAGMGDAKICVGERLSYPDEKLTRGTASELSDYTCAPLSAVLLEYPIKPRPLSVGLPDDAFIRDNVPMTKSEVRAVSISKLKLTDDAIVYDIGAGTGSVSVEIALNCPRGRVYAIERDQDAAALVERNRAQFGLRNLHIIPGTAPEALEGLPSPTHAFIGGSGGHMAEIVGALLTINPRVRIVANAIALESAGELADIAARFGFEDCEIVQLNLSRSRRAGRYHMMTGMNPIYIAAFQRREGTAHES